MNNRQANGRRRGRGGQQRQGGGNPGQGNGNRIDNRARGNAAQLLEKYKNLAADAQRQGDRVNAEYYLQFADHYFRVLSETRSRFEEQNQQRRPRDEFDGDEEDFDLEADGNRMDDVREDRPQREDRGQREPRGDREQPRREFRDRDGRDRDDRRNGYANGNANGHVNGQAEPASEQPGVDGRDNAEERPRRRRTRRDEAPAAMEAAPGLDLAVLPPAFGIEAIAPAEADAEEAPKKPRRRRTAKNDDVPEAPAA
jgi:hypothetical protein